MRSRNLDLRLHRNQGQVAMQRNLMLNSNSRGEGGATGNNTHLPDGREWPTLTALPDPLGRRSPIRLNTYRLRARFPMHTDWPTLDLRHVHLLSVARRSPPTSNKKPAILRRVSLDKASLSGYAASSRKGLSTRLIEARQDCRPAGLRYSIAIRLAERGFHC